MKEQAYQVFMSAVNNENIRLLSQSKDGLSNIKLGLGITVSMRNELNHIWDYYANNKIMEKYLQKRAQVKKQQQEMLNEKIVKQDQERNRLLQSWNNERQLAKASDTYEANFMTETVADGASLLG